MTKDTLFSTKQDKEHKYSHTISVLVENAPGVLARISGLFARRSFNIDSLTVHSTENPRISRMTVVSYADFSQLEQLIKQLGKLIEVISVIDHTQHKLIERELVLIKLKINKDNRQSILELAKAYNAGVASMFVKEGTIILDLHGEVDNIDAFVEDCQKFTIIEMVRSGRSALMRGARLT